MEKVLVILIQVLKITHLTRKVISLTNRLFKKFSCSYRHNETEEKGEEPSKNVASSTDDDDTPCVGSCTG